MSLARSVTTAAAHAAPAASPARRLPAERATRASTREWRASKSDTCDGKRDDSTSREARDTATCAAAPASAAEGRPPAEVSLRKQRAGAAAAAVEDGGGQGRPASEAAAWYDATATTVECAHCVSQMIWVWV